MSFHNVRSVLKSTDIIYLNICPGSFCWLIKNLHQLVCTRLYIRIFLAQGDTGTDHHLLEVIPLLGQVNNSGEIFVQNKDYGIHAKDREKSQRDRCDELCVAINRRS